jgi:hypothetical protein
MNSSAIRRTVHNGLKRMPAYLTTAAIACAIGASGAAARLIPDHGQLYRPGAHLSLNTNTSGNWFGYNIGTLERGGTLFHSISGSWIVPTATQHTRGQAEDSADWIGIGGGCVDTGCSVTDNTLIQTGTEQDVASDGSTSYDAWWEIIPVPELEITNFTVKPGDHMRASIAQVVNDSDVWKVTIQDLSRNETYTTTVPYTSTMDTAEWIEETPLEIGTDAGLAALPNLSSPDWTGTQVNGAPANLKPSEEMYLTDANGKVIGAPSAPGSDHNSFNECTWASTCTAP